MAMNDGSAPGADSCVFVERASAKLNLTLEITGRRPDGYHHLLSLVGFATCLADIVTLHPRRVGPTRVSGPGASAIEGQNIVDRILAQLPERYPGLKLGTVEIDKRIPVAAGLGGGSADAAAVLRAIARHNAITDPEAEFLGQAATWGADIPVCLGADGAKAAMMAGIGECVWRPPVRQRLIPQGVWALLVNPQVPVATADVFRQLSAAPLESAQVPVPAIEPLRSFAELLAFIRSSRNDLEPPARKVEPMIGRVLAAIAEQPECAIARMSGSGATCFGLFAERYSAQQAHDRLAAAEPGWWLAVSALD